MEKKLKSGIGIKKSWTSSKKSSRILNVLKCFEQVVVTWDELGTILKVLKMSPCEKSQQIPLKQVLNSFKMV